jgi:predicted PurR-regulated permease PerM
LPTLAAELSTKVYQFGPFEFNLNQFDLQAISQQLLSALQPLLGRVGGLLSTLATGAAVIFGWGLFVLLISYFVLVDAGQVSGELFSVELPGYSADIRRLGIELRNIWNAFLRGQFVIFLLVIVIFSILATVLGVRYSLAIALLAGVARFVPYVGPLTTYGVMVLVILLQGNHIFGLAAWQHALLVIGVCLLLDQTLDSLIVPRFLGDALGVHPAAVLLAAIIAANLIGLVGLVLAAPVVATLKLLGRYSFRKMLDLDPWPPSDKKIRIMEYPWERWTRRVRAWLRLKSR